MTTRIAHTAQRFRLPEFTVNESAFVAKIDARNVQSAIDREKLAAVLRVKGKRSIRCVPATELLVFACASKAEPDVTFGVRTQNAIRSHLKTFRAELETSLCKRETHLQRAFVEGFDLALGDMRMDIGDLFIKTLDDMRRVLKSREVVDEDPEIRGGDPVVRGTRIPVSLLAELRAQGAPDKELLEDYPSLTTDTLAFALLWAKLHPALGRPSKPAPWHDQPGRVLLAAKNGPFATVKRVAPKRDSSR
jgi:uncharacterized protein (DUF433 family)